MKDNIIHIKLFKLLDEIREKYEIPNGDWAKASGIHAARISELRVILKGDKIGRDFTFHKLNALGLGLNNIVGGYVLQKEAIEKLKMIDDLKEQIIFLTCVIHDQDPKKLKQKLLSCISNIDLKTPNINV